MDHHCLHIEAAEIRSIIKQQDHINVAAMYEDAVDCEFKEVFMGNHAEYSFPAIAIYERETDEIRSLIQLEGDKIFILEPVKEDEAHLEDSGLPLGVK